MNIEQTDTQQAAPEIARANRRGRVVLAVAFVLAAVTMALYVFIALPYLKSAISVTAPPDAVAFIKQIVIALVVPVSLAGIYLIWYGNKISRAGRFPLPDAWVWRDTAVKRGRAVVKIARLHYAAGALIGILGIALAAYLWIMLDRLAPPVKLPPGVKILQQRSISR